MALLNRRRGTERGWRAPVAALGAGSLLAGCILMGVFDGGHDGPAFPHAVHVAEGFDCVDCHQPMDDVDRASMPPLDTCLLCHEDMDEEKPPERRAEAFFVGGEPRPGVLRLPDEVLFSHSGHVEIAGEDCTVCHDGFDQSERVVPADAITMDECMSCHDALGVDNSCTSCHSRIDRDWAPANHALSWTMLHGEAFRAREMGVANRCDLCHQESTCTQCHQSQPPANHDNFWRLRGHAVPASLERESCDTCHRTDFCNRCHESTEPLSHTGSFGGTLNTHCVSCHFPLQSESCRTCHQGTPSHTLAAPQPPDHVPGANCRLCHGSSAPLPHLDNGSDCTFCHK